MSTLVFLGILSGLRGAEKWSAFWMCGSATLTMVASSTTISCAVAMTARARPSRRGGEPADVAAPDAAAVLTSRVGCPVSGGVADKTILPSLSP